MCYEGLYENIDNEIYRQWEGVSKSDIDAWVNPWRTPPNEENMILGSCVHCLVLEPDAPLESRFAVTDRTIDLRKKQEKEYWLKHVEASVMDGVEPIRKQAFVAAKKMAEALLSHREIRAIIESSKYREVSGVCKLRDFENKREWPFLCKARADSIGGDFINDVKTTGESDQLGFRHSVFRFRYNVQAAFYASIFGKLLDQPLGFRFLCVSKRSLECWVTTVGDATMAGGRAHYTDLLRAYEMWHYDKKEEGESDGNFYGQVEGCC